MNSTYSEAFKAGFTHTLQQFQKQAESTPFKEWAGQIPGTALIGNAPSTIGGTIGMFDGYNDDDVEDYDNGLMSLIPGYGAYLMNKRRGIVVKKMREKAKELGDEKKVPQANNVAEILAPLLHSGVGAGVGAALSKNHRGAGAAAGAAVPLIANIIGELVAMAKKRRSDEEQLKSETKSNALAKWTIPGLAGHDQIMRIGKSRDYVGKNKKKKKKESDDE